LFSFLHPASEVSAFLLSWQPTSEPGNAANKSEDSKEQKPNQKGPGYAPHNDALSQEIGQKAHAGNKEQQKPKDYPAMFHLIESPPQTQIAFGKKS
jgi:hypothetical protein